GTWPGTTYPSGPARGGSSTARPARGSAPWRMRYSRGKAMDRRGGSRRGPNGGRGHGARRRGEPRRAGRRRSLSSRGTRVVASPHSRSHLSQHGEDTGEGVTCLVTGGQ